MRGVRAAPQQRRGGVLICGLRSHTPEQVLEMARLATQCHGAGGVVGFDLAGDEGTYPLELHRRSVEHCVAAGLPVTVHAGEWPGTAANVALALDLGCARIGHGWGMARDAALMARAAAAGVTVEVCLTSNVKPAGGSGWIGSYEAHPVRAMFDAGVRVALSSDNNLLSGDAERPANATAELAHLVDDCGFSWGEARQVLRNGARGAFLPGPERAEFVEGFEAALIAAEPALTQ